ncbi:hypothetical protein ACFL2V_06525 [Pseudomonadota bacterium]
MTNRPDNPMIKLIEARATRDRAALGHARTEPDVINGAGQRLNTRSSERPVAMSNGAIINVRKSTVGRVAAICTLVGVGFGAAFGVLKFGGDSEKKVAETAAASVQAQIDKVQEEAAEDTGEILDASDDAFEAPVIETPIKGEIDEPFELKYVITEYDDGVLRLNPEDFDKYGAAENPSLRALIMRPELTAAGSKKYGVESKVDGSWYPIKPMTGGKLRSPLEVNRPGFKDPALNGDEELKLYRDWFIVASYCPKSDKMVGKYGRQYHGIQPIVTWTDGNIQYAKYDCKKENNDKKAALVFLDRLRNSKGRMTDSRSVYLTFDPGVCSAAEYQKQPAQEADAEIQADPAIE